MSFHSKAISDTVPVEMLNNDNRCFWQFTDLYLIKLSSTIHHWYVKYLNGYRKHHIRYPSRYPREGSHETLHLNSTPFFCFCLSDCIFFVFSTTRQWRPLTWRVTATAWAAHLQHEQSGSIHLGTKPAKKFRVAIRRASVCTLLQEISDIKRMTADNKRSISNFCTECFGSVYF